MRSTKLLDGDICLTEQRFVQSGAGKLVLARKSIHREGLQEQSLCGGQDSGFYK